MSFKFYENRAGAFFTVEALIDGNPVRYIDETGRDARFAYRELSSTGAVGQRSLEQLASRLDKLERGHTRAGD